MIDEKEDYYKYLLYKAVNEENINLLTSILKEYTPDIPMDIDSLDLYCEENNIFNIKYVTLTSEKNLNTILHMACAYGSLDIVKYLIENSVDVHCIWDCAVKVASSNGKLEVVKYLIEQGADIHSEEDFAFRWASIHGHLDVVKYLSKNGANIHANNDDALKSARKNGHLDIVDYIESL